MQDKRLPHSSRNELEIQLGKGIITFKIAGKTFQQMTEWQYSLDKRAFDEQLATGYTQIGIKISASMLEVMKQAKQQGKILPYFAMDCAGGCFSYYFQVFPSECRIKITHPVMKDTLELEVSDHELEIAKGITLLWKKSLSSFRGWYKRGVSRDEDKAGKDEFVFQISDKEYQNLSSWRNWNQERAFSPRYIYEFSHSTLGIFVSVEDIDTKEKFNVTRL